MNAKCTCSRMSFVRLTARVTALAVAFAGVVLACGGGSLVVGDDSRDATPPSDEGAAPDTLPPDANAKDTSTGDAKSDAPPRTCAAAPGGPGTCMMPGDACEKADTTGLTCPTAGDFCCITMCPELAPPPPACDGGYTALYDSKACVVGFSCGPVACSAAGGTCVGLAPGSCKNNKFGDATKYSCGPGIGSGCCLPSP